MAIAFVQSKTGFANNNNSLGATFNSTTVAGNLLIAVVSSVGTVTYTPPAGWSLAKQQDVSLSTVAIYYYENAPATSGAITFSINASPASSVIILAEYSGIATSGALDVTGSNTGSGTSQTTGSAGPTNLQNELLIGALACNTFPGTNTYSSPLNSFTLRAQLQEPGDNQDVSVLLDRIVSTTGTYSTGATASQTTLGYAGVIATFKSNIGDNFPGNKLLFSPRATPLVMPGVGNKLLKGP